MDTKIEVPSAIILNGDGVQRTIRLENCQTQQDVMNYLDMCFRLGEVQFEEK